MAYDKVISLGASCQVAHQIRRNFPAQPESYLFDWLGTYNEESLAAAICDGVSEIGRLENLSVRVPKVEGDKYWKIQDDKYIISMMHQFPSIKLIEDGYGAFRGKFDFLTKRWNDLAASDAAVLFVRTIKGNSKIDDSPILEAVRERHPTLNFDMLFVHTDGSASPALRRSERVLVGGVGRSTDWKGDDGSWEALFQSLDEGRPLPEEGCRPIMGDRQSPAMPSQPMG